jgi:ferric-dicitrate binding protein FerR (iron transport regulator)
MRTSDDLSRADSDRISNEAADWLTRLSNDLPDSFDIAADTAATSEEFLLWLAQSADHTRIFLEIAEIDRKLFAVNSRMGTDIAELLRAARAEVAAAEWSTPPDKTKGAPKRCADETSPVWVRAAMSPFARLLAMAAAAVSVFCGLFLSQSPLVTLVPRTETHRYVIYRTKVGRHADYPLTDGSRLILNTNSEAAVDYTDGSRTVRLRGEALFDVRHNEKRPFLVCVGSLSVADVGTSFSVKQTATSAVLLTVAEGSVLVTGGAAVNRQCAGAGHGAGDGQNYFPSGSEQGAPPLKLTAGEQAEITVEDKIIRSHVKHLDPADVGYALAWRSGDLYIDSSLQQGIEEINRYIGGKRFAVLPSIADFKIRVLLTNASSPEAVLKALHEVGGFVPTSPPKGRDPDPNTIYIGPDPGPKAPHRSN